MTDDQIKHYRDKLSYEIDSADLAQVFIDDNNSKKVVVIDARSTKAYNEQHIPGAINFPHRTMDEESVHSLNRDTLYVIYCDGIGCNASTKGALKLARLGFKVKELMGGLDWWKRDGYSTAGKTGGEGSFEVYCAC